MASGEIIATFASHMDKAGADAAVETCHAAFHEAAKTVRGLEAELTEALMSAPRFAAEEARARAFGARALDEFKPRHRWSRPGNADLGIYEMDLASTEWHGQPKVARASAFKDIDSAQRMTQYTIDANQKTIKERIER
ncbi:hypothetical protein ACFWRV_33965 [Streptomyces sp. NPDC058576]|uniref:hypothetical protein n=1 Tax=Streptomyces sp. NPDC058576 TaxID=3346547 RepID=UPI0036505DCF